MMRALWTAASGMISQQMNVDTISNNLANVNTAGYKKERVEFKTLLYETLQRATVGTGAFSGQPVNLQVGHGVRPTASSKMFTVGNMQRTDHKLDFAIEGEGFFTIKKLDGTVAYTKDGTFKVSVVDNGYKITTSEGYDVLGVDGEPLVVPTGIKVADLVVSETGDIGYVDELNNIIELGIKFDIVQFTNIQGLESSGSNLLTETPASGTPIRESEGEITRLSRIVQGTVELSNVQVAEEMVTLITAQRAYELNSKAIQTSDDMLATANNLKRM